VNLRLNWERVDFVAEVVRLDIRTSKNADGRTLPFDLLPELADVLRRQRLYTDAFEAMSGHTIPWVFHQEGRPIRDYAHRWRTTLPNGGPFRKLPA
jgi:hypothetical protein